MEPTTVAKFDARPRIAALPDDTLTGIYVLNEAHAQEVSAISSVDRGRTWSEPRTLFSLPVDRGRWGGCEVLVDREGELHLFLLNDRGTGVFADPAGEGEIERKGLYQRRLDIWHCSTADGRQRWRPPKCIWEGYTGALNSVVQLRSGRILLPFSFLTARTWAERGEGLDAFWYAGQLNSTLVYSDDGGDTWRRAAAELKVQTPSIGLYGGCEPVVVQLLDGRVCMLIRTQLGRLYESFSDDGCAWSKPRPTRLISSDSPVGLVRLPDDRLVLLWNKCLRFPYAHGGRHVLHAAISEDDGRTWIGQREVVRDPLRHEPPPPGGDFGTAYPFPAALPNGEVILTTGQGKGRIAVVALDPAWLYETRQETDFSEGLENWSVFGCKGVALKSHPQKRDAQVLCIAKTDPEWPAAAVWNFPAAASGRLRLSICLQEGCGGGRIVLTDHFSVPFDPEDALYSLYKVDFCAAGGTSGGLQLNPGHWHNVCLAWDGTTRICKLVLDEHEVAVLPLRRESEGVCYFRAGVDAEEEERGGLLIERIEVEISSQ